MLGSRATTDPARSPSPSSAAFCTSRSSVRYMSVPGRGSSMPRSFTFLPAAFTWIMRLPATPAKIFVVDLFEAALADQKAHVGLLLLALRLGDLADVAQLVRGEPAVGVMPAGAPAR